MTIGRVVFGVMLALASTSHAGAQQSRRTASSSASARALAIRAEMASVLLQSKRYDEAANEYALLVAYAPDNLGFRLGLARALAWGERYAAAERELTVLSARRPNDPAIESLLLSTRQQLRPPARESARWLAERRTVEYRQIHARALARERRSGDAVAQFDTLLLERPSPALLLERAFMHLDRRDYAGVEIDASASIAMGPSAPAYLLLSELHRSRGNFAEARRALDRARALPHQDLAIAEQAAQLARDERPAIALLPDVAEPLGWLTSTGSTQDNLGVNFTTLTVARGRSLSHRLDGSIGGTARWLTSRGTELLATPMQRGSQGALGGGGALSTEGRHGPLYARARVKAALLYHAESGLAPEVEAAATLFHSAWGVGVDLSTGPAYPSLLTLASFLPLTATDAQLRERSAKVSVAGPLGRVDVAVSQDISAFSDGNLRRTVQAYARLPFPPRFALVYAGNGLSFSKPSLLYWDPERYVAHAIGPEITLRRRAVRGATAAIRLLPGYASSDERLHVATRRTVRHSQVMQLGGGLDLGYRGSGWEVAGTASYGTGRSADYQRLDASIAMRVAP